MNAFPVLSLRGFGVAFGQRVVLDEIALELSPSGVDVLMGPVKTGKSTLFRTLSGMYQGHALHKQWGEILVNGYPYGEGNRPALVLQHAGVFNLTLLQALLEPSRKVRQHSPAMWRELGVDWLSKHGLEEAIPLIDVPMLRCPLYLQRSVMVLAQALLNPPLLLVDEPTYSLKDAEAAWFMNWLKQLSGHCRLWVALHNQMQAKILADRIVLLGGGHLVAYQPTAAFFGQPANEHVAQFVTTGSLSLPDLAASAQDLADDVALPPPLSQQAQQSMTVAPSVASSPSPVRPASLVMAPPIDPVKVTIPAQPVAPVAPVTPVAVTPPVVPPVSVAPVAKAAPLVTPRPLPASVPVSAVGEATRKLAALPATSRQGVELAASVGRVFFHDSSAPRGFHWIVPGKLAGCPAPGVVSPLDYDLGLLAKTGITKLITLTETDLNQSALRKHNLSNLHLPIFDREAPSVGQTHMLLVRMQKAIDAGEVLAVHCKAGLGRTGTILAAWLIREGGLSADDAINRIRNIEPGYIQSVEQEEFLQEYEEDLVRRLL